MILDDLEFQLVENKWYYNIFCYYMNNPTQFSIKKS